MNTYDQVCEEREESADLDQIGQQHQQSRYEEVANSRRHQDEIIRITIDLGSDQQPENIVVLRGQEHMSDELAHNFCVKHGFDDKIKAALTQQISKNIQQALLQLKQTPLQSEQLRESDANALQNPSIINTGQNYKDLTSPDNFGEMKPLKFNKLDETDQTNRLQEVQMIDKSNNMKQLHQKFENLNQMEKNYYVQQMDHQLQSETLHTDLEQMDTVNEREEFGYHGQSEPQHNNRSNVPRENGAVNHVQMPSNKFENDFNQQAHYNMVQLRSNQRKQTKVSQIQQLDSDMSGPMEASSAAAVRSPHNHHDGEMVNEDVFRQDQQNQPKELLVSEIVSDYGGKISNIVHDNNQFQNNGRDELQYEDGDLNPRDLTNSRCQLPADKINFYIQHPECRSKPQINENSRLLAQGKRTNEPIHERLYKQEILSKKIAQEIENELLNEEGLNRKKMPERSKSAQKFERPNSRSRDLGRQRSREPQGGDQGQPQGQELISAMQRRKSAARIAAYREDEGAAQRENPGARLYKRGLKMNQDKEQYIQIARKHLADQELLNHCTFKPQLVTQTYYSQARRQSPDSPQELSEFDEVETARNHNKPLVATEKLIVKQGETIHLKKLREGEHPGRIDEPGVAAPVATNEQRMSYNDPMYNNLDIDNEPQAADEPAPDRLMRYGQKIHQKRQHQKAAYDAAQDQEFNHQPRINQRSRSIANSKKQIKYTVDQLNERQVIGSFNNQPRPENIDDEQQQPYASTNQLQHNQDQSFYSHSNYDSSQLNQTQMPGGDDDQEVDDMSEEEADDTFVDVEVKDAKVQPHEQKFMVLYDDAKHRTLRQKNIYSKCIDPECTFNPQLITKKSKVSQNTIKQVQKHVMDKSQAMGSSVIGVVNQGQQQEKKAEKPAVGGVPPQEFLTNSRMTYLSGTESGLSKSMQGGKRNLAKSGSTQKMTGKTTAEGEVFERLAKQAEIFQQVKKQKKELCDQTVTDPTTGCEFFKPQINQNFHVKDRPVQQSSTQSSSTLYERHKLIQEKKQKLVNQEIQRVTAMSQKSSKANKLSDQIVQQARKNKINELFDFLDDDKDGEISSLKINSDNLPSQLKEVFKPLFQELEQIQEPLDRDEFMDASLRLYSTLNQNDKNAILRFGKQKIENDYQLEKCTFKPKTNQNYNNQKPGKLGMATMLARPHSAMKISTIPKSQSNYASTRPFGKSSPSGSIMEQILGKKAPQLSTSKQVLNRDLDLSHKRDKSPSRDPAGVQAQDQIQDEAQEEAHDQVQFEEPSVNTTVMYQVIQNLNEEDGFQGQVRVQIQEKDEDAAEDEVQKQGHGEPNMIRHQLGRSGPSDAKLSVDLNMVSQQKSAVSSYINSQYMYRSNGATEERPAPQVPFAEKGVTSFNQKNQKEGPDGPAVGPSRRKMSHVNGEEQKARSNNN